MPINQKDMLKAIESWSSKFDIVLKKTVENKNIKNTQIAILTSDGIIVLEEKSEEKTDEKEDDDKEPSPKQVKEEKKSVKNDADKKSGEINKDAKYVIEVGKKLKFEGNVDTVERFYHRISTKSGTFEMYLPVGGLAVGDKLEVIVRKV